MLCQPLIIKFKVYIKLNIPVVQAVHLLSQVAQVVVDKKLPKAQAEHVVSATNMKIKILYKFKYT